MTMKEEKMISWHPMTFGEPGTSLMASLSRIDESKFITGADWYRWSGQHIKVNLRELI